MGFLSGIGKAIGSVAKKVAPSFVSGPIGSVIGTVGSTVLGGLDSFAEPAMSYLGSRQATAQSIEEAERNRKFQAEQARLNRQFQERLSSTAHQRQMDDLAAAGINPLLTARLGGASTASGSMASGAMPTIQNALGAAASSALRMREINNKIKQTEENINLTKAQVDTEKARRWNYAMDSGLKQFQQTETQERTKEIQQRTKNIGHQEEGLKADEEFYKEAGPFFKWLDRILGAGSSARSITR